jgi:hypothetical protein
MDQLYDQHADFDIKLSDDEYAGDENLAVDAAKIADGNGSGYLRYTHVNSPAKTGLFTQNNVLYKIKPAQGESKTIVFNADTWGTEAGKTTKFTSSHVDLAGSSKVVVASEGKSVSVQDFGTGNERTFDGTTYKGWMQLGGSGSVTSRAIALNVKLNAGATITVDAVSSSASGDPRTLIVAYKDPETDKTVQLGTIGAPNSSSNNSMNLSKTVTLNEAFNGPIYIYSKNSGINVYGITVTNG